MISNLIHLWTWTILLCGFNVFIFIEPVVWSILFNVPWEIEKNIPPAVAGWSCSINVKMVGNVFNSYKSLLSLLDLSMIKLLNFANTVVDMCIYPLSSTNFCWPIRYTHRLILCFLNYFTPIILWIQSLYPR